MGQLPTSLRRGVQTQKNGLKMEWVSTAADGFQGGLKIYRALLF